MRLINQFGDELAIGDTVVHSATDHVGKIKAVSPTAQNPKGALGILWSGNSDIEEVCLPISVPRSNRSAANNQQRT